MVHHVHAIYDAGVFKPLEPLALPDQSRVTITVDVVEPHADAGLPTTEDEIRALVAEQREAARELSAKLASLPDLSPDDGFTSADHDKVLYGEPT
jgi:predicted DNA-binding antitoxin AbrB/MazE fold protein